MMREIALHRDATILMAFVPFLHVMHFVGSGEVSLRFFLFFSSTVFFELDKTYEGRNGWFRFGSVRLGWLAGMAERDGTATGNRQRNRMERNGMGKD
jgi:hypothetical protein